jgi:cytochrome c2
MRKTKLRHATFAIVITLVSVAVLFALLRAFVIHPADSLAEKGSPLFVSEGCSQCHFVDSRKTKIGPGLQGLFERDELTVSGRKTTEENVRKQLETPYEDMPSFADRLTEEQRDQLISYMKTL